VASIPPQVESKEVLIAIEREEVSNKESNWFGMDKEFEGSVHQLGDTKKISQTPNGGLENGTD